MSKTSGVATVARKMLADLNRRFTFATNPEVYKFDAIYVSSTLVNPAYRKILNNSKSKKAREFLLQLMLMRRDAEMEQTLTENEQTNFNTVESTEKDNQDVQPPAKRFKHLERVSKLLDKDDEQEMKKRTAQLKCQRKSNN